MHISEKLFPLRHLNQPNVAKEPGESIVDDVYDIKIFQQLPLPLRMQFLKGKVLYEDDTPFMYDKANETIEEFESFKRGYYDYLGIESIT